ncbi:hypothetical protein LCGC14_1474260 [marine sediment metagenome]|uniref:Uncharacterized protein n=1 Tax=marine sediment metagenome TaxID=412755 RepID=A0A0F9JC35_9ZZZZ
MTMEHRYAEALREVAELKSQIAVMHAGYNCALKERDNLKGEVARLADRASVSHAVADGRLDIMIELRTTLERLRARAKECVMSQGEILCDACAEVTRELRDDPRELALYEDVKP